MNPAVCNIKCAECSIKCAVCSIECAVFSIKCAVYSIKYVVCSMCIHIVSNLLNKSQFNPVMIVGSEKAGGGAGSFSGT